MSNKYRSVKKKLILRQLQSDVDKVVPDNYSGEIRTDSWENYKKDSDKYFDVLVGTQLLKYKEGCTECFRVFCDKIIQRSKSR